MLLCFTWDNTGIDAPERMANPRKITQVRKKGISIKQECNYLITKLEIVTITEDTTSEPNK